MTSILQSDRITDLGFEEPRPRPKEHYEKTVFVIDDDEIIVGLITEILRVSGFTSIHGFTKSTEALELLKYVSPDLIVTDIHMPDLSGTFFAKLVKESPQLNTVPLLAMTGDNSGETLGSAICNGIFDVVYKPIDGNLLVSKIIDILDWVEHSEDSLAEVAKQKSNSARQSECNLYELFGRDKTRTK